MSVGFIFGGYDLSESIAKAEKVPVLGVVASAGGLALNAVMAVHGLVMSILKVIFPFKCFDPGPVGESFRHHTGEFFNRILNIALLGMPRALDCRGPFPKVPVYEVLKEVPFGQSQLGRKFDQSRADFDRRFNEGLQEFDRRFDQNFNQMQSFINSDFNGNFGGSF